MGLAAPKKRRKLGHDPNNTAWTRDTSAYGHRILAAHGWTPGSFLGAKDAAHAAHYTAANASHIRVELRDDNLGLGARRPGAGNDPLADQTFGLGGFQDLLSRLNGKSEASIEKERGARKDMERKRYVETRWGAGRTIGSFVSGGFLVGDRIIEDGMEEDGHRIRIKMEEESDEDKVKLEEESDSGMDGIKIEPAAHIKVEEEREVKREANSGAEEDDDQRSRREKRKRKKRKEERKKDLRQEAEAEKEAEQLEDVEDDEPDLVPEKESKEERRQRKQEKKARKEAKRLAKAATLEDGNTSSSASSSTTMKQSQSTDKELSQQTVKPDTLSQPREQQQTVVQISQIPIDATGGRHFARQRYIKQKRMAMMDPKALAEILMVNS